MTTSLDLLELMYQAVLQAGTDADARVYKPGDWPTQETQYPIVKMRLVAENRQSLGRGGPSEFITIATIRTSAEVSAPGTIDDAGAVGAESQVWILKRQIEVAIVNSYPLSAQIQQIVAMRSQLSFSAESATHLAGVQIDTDLEFYEGPEDFAPVAADEIDEIHFDLTNHPPAGATFHLDQ